MKTFFKSSVIPVLFVLFINGTSYSQSTVNEHSVKFLDINSAMLVGEDGVIMKTTDGGQTWADQTSGVTNVLYGNAFVDANTSFAVGENGLILKTVDGGNNWSILDGGTVNHLKGVDVVNST